MTDFVESSSFDLAYSSYVPDSLISGPAISFGGLDGRLHLGLTSMQPLQISITTSLFSGGGSKVGVEGLAGLAFAGLAFIFNRSRDEKIQNLAVKLTELQNDSNAKRARMIDRLAQINLAIETVNRTQSSEELSSSIEKLTIAYSAYGATLRECEQASRRIKKETNHDKRKKYVKNGFFDKQTVAYRALQTISHLEKDFQNELKIEMAKAIELKTHSEKLLQYNGIRSSAIDSLRQMTKEADIVFSESASESQKRNAFASWNFLQQTTGLSFSLLQLELAAKDLQIVDQDWPLLQTKLLAVRQSLQTYLDFPDQKIPFLQGGNILQERIIMDFSTLSKTRLRTEQYTSMPMTEYLVIEKTSRALFLDYRDSIPPIRVDQMGDTAAATDRFVEQMLKYPAALAPQIQEHNHGLRIRGLMQAANGFMEAGIGAGVALGSDGIAAGLGWSLMAHGFDQFQTGINSIVSGKDQNSATTQLLQKAGMTSRGAELTNDYIILLGSLGGSAAIRASQLATMPIYSSAGILATESQTVSYAQESIRWAPIGAVGHPERFSPLNLRVANSFRSASYTQLDTTEEIILYRVYGGRARKVGDYWTRTPPTGPLQAKLDNALLPEWGNPATQVVKIKVPPGVRLYEGFAGSQKGLLGGGSQIFIEKVNPNWVIP